jgi:apolipoprotein D and lipocalin family protein
MKLWYLVLIGCFPLYGFSQQDSVVQPVQTVPYVDLSRFSGKWYEIARLRKPWERECALNTTVTYTVESADTLQVYTECQQTIGFGRLEKVNGTALILDQITQAKWKVTFPPVPFIEWIFSGEYWVIQLADDYTYTVLCDPSHSHLWILSRTPTIPEDTYQVILDKAALQLPDINVLNILRTEHKAIQTNN